MSSLRNIIDHTPLLLLFSYAACLSLAQTKMIYFLCDIASMNRSNEHYQQVSDISTPSLLPLPTFVPLPYLLLPPFSFPSPSFSPSPFLPLFPSSSPPLSVLHSPTLLLSSLFLYFPLLPPSLLSLHSPPITTAGS